MNPIYKPAGRALEYSPDALALNIYTGCNHGCKYCFAPGVLRKTREDFHNNVAPRDGIVDAVKRRLDKGTIIIKNDDGEKHKIELKDKLIHLCFTCDPYPANIDTTATREIIKAIKDSGNHVQILTKGGMRAERDLDLLDSGDWFGVTITGYTNPLSNEWRKYEPQADSPFSRLTTLLNAHMTGIKTWVSCEPVIEPEGVYSLIERESFIDLFRIGKLNHADTLELKSIHDSIDWAAFGQKCIELCEQNGRQYYIKNDLRKELEDAI